MSKKFDVNNVDLEIIDNIEDRVEDIEGKAEYNLRQILLKEIALNEKNNFRINDIEELAESLKKYGQLHNVVVRRVNNDEKPYKLISGERRFKAAESLGWESIACKIVECDDLDEEILLITANLDTRQLNDIERSKNAERLFELITEKRKNGEKFNGKKTRELVAEKLNVAPATVQKLRNLKNLIPEFQKMVEEKEIGLELANQYAQMYEETQRTVYAAIKDGLKLTAKTAKELKDKLKKTEDDTKNIIDNLKNELNEKDQVLKLNKEEVANKEMLILKLNEEMTKIKSKQEVDNIDLENVREKVRQDLEKELENKDEKNQEKINQLKKQLEYANNNILSSKKESEDTINDLKNQISNLKEDTKEKFINNTNIEKSLEITVLLKQTNELIEKIYKIKNDNEIKFSEENYENIELIIKKISNLK